MRLNLSNYSTATISMLVVILLTTVSGFAQESNVDSTKSKVASAESQSKTTAGIVEDRKATGSAIADTKEKTETIKEEAKTEVSDTTTATLTGVRSIPFAAQAKAFNTSTGSSPEKPKQATSGSEWQYGAALYLWLPGLSGDVGANNRTLTIDLSPLDTLKHLKAGFMGTFEARRGRFVMLTDLLWSKLTEENDTRGPLYNTTKVSVNMTIFDPQAGVRVAESKAGSFDILGGVRITSVKNILSTTTGVVPGFTAEARKTWAAPTIGGHGLINLSAKAYLSTIFDIGGGFGTHLTGQFYGGMGYRIKPKFAMIFGYRYLKNDYSDDSGFIYNTNMHGLVFGSVFRF